jgi:acyl-ACP thioesterase
VRLGDVRMGGRLRLDALARYLQDIANDDAMDAGLEGAMSWVVRRVTIEVGRWPQFADMVELITFCGAIGSRFAERRTSVLVGGEAVIEANSLWVYFDPISGRPAVLPAQFDELYAQAAGGRKASSRLGHPPPPAGAARRAWPQRVADHDLLGHTNNAVALAAVEEALGDGVPASVEVEVEYRDAIEPGDAVELVTVQEPGEATPDAMWLTVAGQVRVSGRMTATATARTAPAPTA